MNVFKPPIRPSNDTKRKYSVFLAGSIEMGKAIDWQSYVTEKLSDLDMTIYNPRRDDWDWTWEQKATNPKFHEQVTWELDMLSESDLIVMYLDPNCKSPISLMELGLHAKHNIVVCCPEGFWRKGNVDMVCLRFAIPTVNTLDELVKYVRQDHSEVANIFRLG